MATDTNNIETPAETFARAIASAETDLDQCLDAIGRPELKGELREFLQGLGQAVAEAQNDG